MKMKPNTKVNIYVFSNMFAWILMCIAAVWAIHRFIGFWLLRYILYPTVVIGLAYFEERIFCQLVGRIVAFVIHDDEVADIYHKKRLWKHGRDEK